MSNKKIVSSLLRDILEHTTMNQKQLAKKLQVSESLVSYWCHNSTATAIHLAPIVKVTKIDAETLKTLILKHL